MASCPSGIPAAPLSLVQSPDLHWIPLAVLGEGIKHTGTDCSMVHSWLLWVRPNSILFLIFKSAGNLSAIPKRVSLNKDETELDLKAKQSLLTSIAVQNITLFHPDLTFPPQGASLLFYLLHPSVCTYRMHLETPKFLSESAFIIQRANRHNPSVLNGCLDKEAAVDTTQPPWTPGDAPACPLQYPSWLLKTTHLKVQICVRLNTRGIAQENTREENYMANANERPTTKSLTAKPGK